MGLVKCCGQLRVLSPPVCPLAPLVAGGGTGPRGALLQGLCPSQVHGGSPWVAQWHQPLTPNRRLSVPVLALQRGGQCQGLGTDPVPARASGLPYAVSGGGQGKHPLSRSPRFPVHLGGEHTLPRSRNCKIKSPRCSGPRSSRRLSGEEMGMGKRRPKSLHAHPAFLLPQAQRELQITVAGAPNRGPCPQPQVCQPPAFIPTATSQWAPLRPGPGRDGRCPINLRPEAGVAAGQTALQGLPTPSLLLWGRGVRIA